jgi:Flp pilus assembly protein TadD
MALLLLVAFLVFSVSLRGPFQFDDNLFLRDPNVRSPNGWTRMHQAGWTRWLPWLTFYWNFRIAGDNPFWYHFVNSSLHLINIALVSAVVRASPVRFSPRYNSGATGRASNPRPHPPEPDDLTPFSGGLFAISSGTVAAAVFAVHPLQTEAVDYIYQRAVLLAAAFGFGSLYLFFRFLRGQRPAIALAIPLLALAILSKESALGLVPIFFMALASSRNSFKLHPYLIAAVAACILAMLSLILRSHLYLFTETLVFWRYLSLFFYPRGLNIDHDVPLVTGLTLPVQLSMLAIGGLVCLFIALPERYRALSFWFFSFLFLLLPTSSVIPASDVMFEHRMYLPMLGLAGMAEGVCILLWKRFGLAPLIAGILCFVFWSALSVFRNKVWLSEISLWENAVEGSPEKYRPSYNLGTALLPVDPRRASRCFEKALQLRPQSLAAWHNLGEARARSGDDSGAIDAWERGLGFYPESAILHRSLGALYSRIRNFKQARQHLTVAMRTEPRSAATFYELALLFFRFGMLHDAVLYGERSLELDDRNAETYLLMAALLDQQGNLSAAERYRREAARRK